MWSTQWTVPEIRDDVRCGGVAEAHLLSSMGALGGTKEHANRAPQAGVSTRRGAAHLEVLGDKPGLEGREEQAGGDAAEDAPHQEHSEVVEVLGEAAERVRDHVGQRCLLSSPERSSRVISQRYQYLACFDASLARKAGAAGNSGVTRRVSKLGIAHTRIGHEVTFDGEQSARSVGQCADYSAENHG